MFCKLKKMKVRTELTWMYVRMYSMYLLPRRGEDSQNAKASCADSGTWRASRTERPNSCTVTLPSPSNDKCTALSPNRYMSTSWAGRKTQLRIRYISWWVFHMMIYTLHIQWESVAEEATLPLCEWSSDDSGGKLHTSPSISNLKHKERSWVRLPHAKNLCAYQCII